MARWRALVFIRKQLSAHHIVCSPACFYWADFNARNVEIITKRHWNVLNSLSSKLLLLLPSRARQSATYLKIYKHHGSGGLPLLPLYLLSLSISLLHFNASQEGDVKRWKNWSWFHYYDVKNLIRVWVWFCCLANVPCQCNNNVGCTFTWFRLISKPSLPPSHSPIEHALGNIVSM